MKRASGQTRGFLSYSPSMSVMLISRSASVSRATTAESVSLAADAKLLGRNGVVLVDDRDAAEAEQHLQRARRVGAAHRRVEVVLRQQNLRDLVSVRSEQPVVHIDQLALADGRRRLLLLRGKRLPDQPDFCQPAAHRARGDEQAFSAAVLHVRNAANQPLGFAQIHQSAGIGQRGGADLDDDALFVFHIQLHIFVFPFSPVKKGFHFCFPYIIIEKKPFCKSKLFKIAGRRYCFYDHSGIRLSPAD